MRKTKQTFVALNISLPKRQKDSLLLQVEAKGFATISEYVRDLIRKDGPSSQSNEAEHSHISDADLMEQINFFAAEHTPEKESSEEQVRVVLDLFERGKYLKEQELRLESPTASEREIKTYLANWVRHKPCALYGDAGGIPNFTRLSKLKYHAKS